MTGILRRWAIDPKTGDIVPLVMRPKSLCALGRLIFAT